MGNELAQTMSATLEQMQPELQKAIPEACGLNAERLVRLCLTTFRNNPKLLKCSRDSILGAIMQAAELGLEIDTKRGHGWLVPFKGECIYLEGYKGLAALAMRSGVVHFIEAVIVYEGEEFVYERGLQPILKHVPDLKHHPISDATFVYAIARMRGGPDKFEVLDREYIDSIKQGAIRKAGGRYTCWDDPDREPEMWKKSAVRYLAKLLPDDTLPPALYKLWEHQDARFYETNEERMGRRTVETQAEFSAALDDAGGGGDDPAPTAEPEPSSTAPAPPANDYSGLDDGTLTAMIDGAQTTINELRDFGVAQDDAELCEAKRELAGLLAEKGRRDA